MGRVIGPWGTRGELKVDVLTDSPARYSPGSVLYLGDDPTRVESSHSLKGRLRVKLDSVNDRTRAESLRGCLLSVPRRDVASLPEGSYYHFQLLDMDVWSEQGERLGRIKEIIVTGSNDVYVVERDRKDLLIPALSGVVLDVDPDRNRMTVNLPEGLE